MSRDMVPHSIHTVYTWTTEIKSRVEGMTSEHMYIAYWP